jgi:hypothetical protein
VAGGVCEVGGAVGGAGVEHEYIFSFYFFFWALGWDERRKMLMENRPVSGSLGEEVVNQGRTKDEIGEEERTRL